DAHAVVGEDAHGGHGVGHGAQLGELLPGQAPGDRAHGLDVAVPGLAAQPPDLLDDAGGVGDGAGVGHGVHGGGGALGGGAGAGGHGPAVLAARFAQVGVQVHQAGQGDEAGGVGDLGSGGVEPGADRGDGAVADQDVGRVAARDARAADQVTG